MTGDLFWNSQMPLNKSYVSEKSLQTLGIRYTKLNQRPGDIIVTMPRAYFQCLNLGYCLHAKINFIVDIPNIDKHIYSMLALPIKYESNIPMHIQLIVFIPKAVFRVEAMKAKTSQPTFLHVFLMK